MYFTKQQIALVVRAFESAEALVKGYFGFQNRDWPSGQYEFRTLTDLRDEEVNKSAFAHLCRYCSDKTSTPGQWDNFFYRICLQDDRILDAIDRSNTFIKLYPLLLYISTHELVHVVRFGRGESDFDAPPEEKCHEEERVHTITHNVLRNESKNDIGLVLDCFSNNYRIAVN